MRKLLPILLLLSAAASASVTVQAKLTDGTGTIARNAFLRFQLQNCGQNFPEDPTLGVSTVQTEFDLRPNQSDGSILYTNLISNDDIKCGQVASTYWFITIMKDQTHPLRDGLPFLLHNGDTFNPSSSQPMTAFPPAPPTSPLCCGNAPQTPVISPCANTNSILPGTTNQVTKYVNGPCAQLGPSSGIDDGINPTQWPLGVTVRAGAFYRTMANGASGTVLNLLVEADATGSAQTASSGSTTVRGIADDGAGLGATQVDVAIAAVHQCLFDNQTLINDFVVPSIITPGYCHDAGSTRPTSGQEIVGVVDSLNTGVSTLAKVSLFPGDTVAPGSSGGGTINPAGCTNANTYYLTAAGVLAGDCSITDDGAGNGTAKSWGFTDAAHAGFFYQVQGPAPTQTAVNAIYVSPPVTVASTFGLNWPASLPVNGNCVQWSTVANVSQWTDAGAPCGTSTVTIQTAGVNNSSQATLNFQTGGALNGLTIVPTNPSGGNEQFALSGTLSGLKLRCETGLGDGLNAMGAATYLQSFCYNDSGLTWTLTGLKCFTDNSGTSTMNATNGAGTALLTGAVTCTNAFAAGTQSGTTTIANGDYIKFTFVADGTSKQTTWVVSITQ